MNIQSKMSNMALATVAAGLFALGGPAVAAEKDAATETVHCVGVNACKGMSSCSGADNTCAGQNSCKGTGYVEMSEKACKQIGGEVVKS